MFIKSVTRFSILILLILCSLISCKKDAEDTTQLAPEVTISLTQEQATNQAKTIEKETAGLSTGDGLTLTLWASDSLAPDPIALKIDEQGRAYITRTNRQKNSEFDIRGHMDWATESISWKTVEDRRAFLRKHFSAENSDENDWLTDLNKDSIHDWRDLTVEKENIYRLEDRNGDGIADFSRLFLEDFNTEITDPAGAIIPFGKDLFVGAAPDVWRVRDENDDGIADFKESISHGFGVHVGFSGHGMSGLTVGPDGKIYWSIGDIGANITDQTGKNWAFPNQGVIARSNPDGSDFEIYAAGLRNTHEFVFDDYGNIITVDNDGDHPGESERLLYVVNGHDAGWRANWQYGKYTDPENNRYHVWMDEGLSIPRHDKQAAHIIPPIRNYHNGPTGMAYNPGTALNDALKGHFFVSEFTGSPSRANVWAFRLQPDGAGFAFRDEQKVLSGVLATGIDFGPDGALYVADWINGWGTSNTGRVWKLDDTEAAQSALRKDVKGLIESDFNQVAASKLGEHLGHQDRRIRQKAQFALVKMGNEGSAILADKLVNGNPQLARVHAIWGITQLARKEAGNAKQLIPLLTDEDAEIRAQAAKMLGDVRFAGATTQLISRLTDESRVRFFAAEALGRIGAPKAIPGLIEVLRNNDDKDVYLRHAAALALARIGAEKEVAALTDDPSRSVRIGAVVALRRMRSPQLEAFLSDTDEYIATETALAINDDEGVPEALEALANLLLTTNYTGEPLIRRSINANLRLGKERNIKQLLTYATLSKAPAELRAEAMAALGTWGLPSATDRVDGFYRGSERRGIDLVRKHARQVIAELLNDQNPAIRAKASEAAGKLQLTALQNQLLTLSGKDPDESVRSAAVAAVVGLGSADRLAVLKRALEDKSEQVRVTALSLLPKQNLPAEELINLFRIVLESASIREQQTAIKGLTDIPLANGKPLLSELIAQLAKGDLPPGLELELAEVIEKSKDANLEKQLADFQASLDQDDPITAYRMALEGGNSGSGWWTFQSHETSQCVRCHGYEAGKGSDVGPNLAGIGNRYDREEILRSLIAPSSKIAPGYGTVYVAMKDGREFSGVLASENAVQLELELTPGKVTKIVKSDIAERIDAASSMPPMGPLLEKGELRNLVEFLSGLTGK